MSVVNACSYVFYKSTQKSPLQGDRLTPVTRAHSNVIIRVYSNVCTMSHNVCVFHIGRLFQVQDSHPATNVVYSVLLSSTHFDTQHS